MGWAAGGPDTGLQVLSRSQAAVLQATYGVGCLRASVVVVPPKTDPPASQPHRETSDTLAWRAYTF
jgi:hypothetical protein